MSIYYIVLVICIIFLYWFTFKIVEYQLTCLFIYLFFSLMRLLFRVLKFRLLTALFMNITPLQEYKMNKDIRWRTEGRKILICSSWTSSKFRRQILLVKICNADPYVGKFSCVILLIILYIHWFNSLIKRSLAYGSLLYGNKSFFSTSK